MKVLSLFDGMACGMLAFQSAGIKVDRYVAFEIDKYAVQTSSHNFPMIEHRGDVFKADFTEFQGFDFLVGGSPCTYWSIAQKNNRETEASGMGWELFSQYVRALHEAQPQYFIYENNKSMANAIRESITETFGFEPICINSALVSAQNRQRLYWVGKRNLDGTYSRVKVDQPEDRGILLRDVLDGVTYPVCADGDKSKTITASYFKYAASDSFKKANPRIGIAEPVASTVLNINPSGKGINGAVGRIDAKSRCLTTNKGEGQKIIVPVAEPVNVTADGKAGTLRATYYKDGIRNLVGNNVDRKTGVAVPVCVAERGRYVADGSIEQRFEAREDGKTNTLTTVQKDNNICEPVRVGSLPRPSGELSTSQAFRVYSTDGKSVNITSGGGGAGAKTGLYAIPVEFDGDVPIKAVSCTDGKTYTVYQVKDGQITIKGKQFPIKLADGFYIIRKLTVSECKRLQTVPEWYEFPVSDSQAYKMLGNGWTVEVIAHLINATQEGVLEDHQLNLFEMAVKL